MDFDRYVGLPWKSGGRGFDGVDCYGLVWLFYAHELGTSIRSFAEAYSNAEDRSETAELFSVGVDGRLPAKAAPGAVVLIRRGKLPCHVGIAAPGRRILHIEKRDGLSVMAPITASLSNRIEGYFRPKVEA